MCIAVLLCSTLQTCKKEKIDLVTEAQTVNANMVLLWNLAGCDVVKKAGGVLPMGESRSYAMINVAMHDALNSIDPKYDTYALKVAPTPDGNPDAAVAQAAHDVIVALFPAQQQYADSLLTASLSNISSANKEAGINVGKAAAMAMIDKRTNDGASIAQYAYTQGTTPGAYRSTPPFNSPVMSGFVAVPGWGKVQPFGLTSGSQFRAAAPYALSSAEYAADLNEIKLMGCKDCPARTADQTEIGLFWLDNVPLSWNMVTRTLISQHQMDAWTAAHLLALVQMAEADANISSFEAKFYYNYWRPITAIQLADEDGNSNTTGDPNWALLAAPTPPVPDYPSNHATDCGAAAELLKNFFKTDNMSFAVTSNHLPGVTRNYTSLSEAAMDVCMSRVYVGYHFRHAVMAGEAQGRQVGDYIYRTCLLKKSTGDQNNPKNSPPPLK